MLLTMRHESIAGSAAIQSQAVPLFHDQPEIVAEPATLQHKMRVGPDCMLPGGEQISTRLAIHFSPTADLLSVRLSAQGRRIF